MKTIPSSVLLFAVRKKIAVRKLTGPANLPEGDVKIGVTYADRSSPRFTMRVWATGKGEEVR